MRFAFAGRWLVPVAWLDELRLGCREAAVAEEAAVAAPVLRRLIEAARMRAADHDEEGSNAGR